MPYTMLTGKTKVWESSNPTNAVEAQPRLMPFPGRLLARR